MDTIQSEIKSSAHGMYVSHQPCIGSICTLLLSDELHAKLVYAEATLIRALLTFTQDQGLFGFINGALKLKECNDIFMYVGMSVFDMPVLFSRKLTKQNDPSRFSSDISYEHFDSGVRMGNGLFNLVQHHRLFSPRVTSPSR